MLRFTSVAPGRSNGRRTAGVSKKPRTPTAWPRSKLAGERSRAHTRAVSKFHTGSANVARRKPPHGRRRRSGEEVQENERGRERESRSGREREGRRVDSPACTWQSKEAINHEDNASPPLSEPRSLGWRVLRGRDEAGAKKRETESVVDKEKGKEKERKTE